MMRRALGLATLLILGAGGLTIPSQGADAPAAAPIQPTPSPPASTPPSGSPSAAPQPLTAVAAVRTYECETEAFGMDFEPFKRTKGAIRISLDTTAAEPREATPGPAGLVAGHWRVEGPGDTHAASIVKLLAEACAKGCPFTMTAKGAAQLWAPAPNSLDKLGAKDQLTIAVMKPDPLSVSISTFRGQDIVALEKGACRSVSGDGAKTADPAPPSVPAPAAAPGQ